MPPGLRFDADAADCRVFTYRDGLLSMVAHDLELRVTRLTVEVDEAARTVAATVDPTSLRVVQALRDGRPLPDALGANDRAQIERSIAGDVLQAARFPEIRFVSTAVADAPGGFRVTGTLVLCGREQTVVVPVRRDGNVAVAEATLHQPDFGIRPYSAMLGALRVKPDVAVRLTVRRPS